MKQDPNDLQLILSMSKALATRYPMASASLTPDGLEVVFQDGASAVVTPSKFWDPKAGPLFAAALSDPYNVGCTSQDRKTIDVLWEVFRYFADRQFRLLTDQYMSTVYVQVDRAASAIRHQNSNSVAEFAKRSELTVERIRQIEHGDPMSIGELSKLARVLGISVDQVLALQVARTGKLPRFKLVAGAQVQDLWVD